MPATTMSKYTLPRAEPEAVGMSSARLAPDRPRAERRDRRRPVARRGRSRSPGTERLVFHEAVGHLGPDRSAPMPLDALFAIASMTKPITGVAGLLLWEEGRLGLADPIERFLPQLGNRRVAVLNERRPRRTGSDRDGARRAIDHNTGPDAPHLRADLWRAWHDRRAPALSRLFQCRGCHPRYRCVPGTARCRTAAVSTRDRLGLWAFHRRHRPGRGGDLRSELWAHSWNNGCSAHSAWWTPVSRCRKTRCARLARPLPRDPDTGAAQSVPDRAQALRFECGGGGLASTALDYLRFAQMLLGGGVLGETRILGRKTVEAMRTNRMTPEIENRIAELDPNSEGYGFGLTVAVRERASTLMGSPGEFYWNGAYGTLWWADPVGGPGGGLHGPGARRAATALPAAHQCTGLPGVGGLTQAGKTIGIRSSRLCAIRPACLCRTRRIRDRRGSSRTACRCQPGQSQPLSFAARSSGVYLFLHHDLADERGRRDPGRRRPAAGRPASCRAAWHSRRCRSHAGSFEPVVDLQVTG